MRIHARSAFQGKHYNTDGTRLEQIAVVTNHPERAMLEVNTMRTHSRAMSSYLHMCIAQLVTGEAT